MKKCTSAYGCRFSPDYLGDCLTRSGTSLVFAGCPVTPTSSQLWYDKAAAPRTDPCAAWGNSKFNAGGEPTRFDLVAYPYGTLFPTEADLSAYGRARDLPRFASLPGPFHRPLAAQMLTNYLDKNGDLVLNATQMGRAIGAGLGSPSRDIPELLVNDIVQSSQGMSEGQSFETKSPYVSAGLGRDGQSRTGTPGVNGQQAGMDPKTGWFRVVSKDYEPADYPASAGDTWYGLGSFDLRTEGKIISGYRCVNVYLYDRYMFAETGLDIAFWPFNVYDNEMAKLHRAGLAKNFAARGRWSGCFLPPGVNRLVCPGHSRLK